MLTEEQLKIHNKSITGSKIASIIGISPFKSKYQLWAEMTGLVETEDISSERMRMGNYAEDMIDNVVRGEFGWEVEQEKDSGKQHHDYDFMFGIIDRFKVVDDMRVAILEYKNIDGMQLKQWEEDGCPPYYETQCRFYSILYDLPCILIAVFGGNTVRHWEFERNAKIEAYLLRESLKFWDDIQNKIAPEPDGSESTGNAIAKLYPANNLDLLDCGDDISALIVQRERFRYAESKAKEFKQEAGNKIKATIGDHEGIVCPDGTKATWKLTKSTVKFDEKQFAEDNEELYKRYLVTKPGYRRLHIRLAPEQKKALEATTTKEGE